MGPFGSRFTARGPGSGVPRRLAQDEVDGERAAPEQLVAGANLDPVTADLLQLHPLEVGDDVRRRGVGRDLDAKSRCLLEARLSGGADDLEAELVRTGSRLQDGDDEAPAVRGGQPRHVDLAEDADRADLSVLRR